LGPRLPGALTNASSVLPGVVFLFAHMQRLPLLSARISQPPL
jgi:hypothetical protein